MKKYAIIVAGGKGVRMGAEIPKQFLLLDNKPVLMHTLQVFFDYDPEIELILVLPEKQQSYWQQLCLEYEFELPHTVVNGGETRFHSVKNALKLVEKDTLVAIHDGVRPLVGESIIANGFASAQEYRAAFPVIPVTDTLRRYIFNGISKWVDRNDYCLVQTPQVFSSNSIKKAYKQDYSEEFTDDISVLEKHVNFRPVMIEGSRENIKITTPIDLIIAEGILKCRT